MKAVGGCKQATDSSFTAASSPAFKDNLMNNEPIAWMNSVGDVIFIKDYNIPLYPKSQIKQLSDEEIYWFAEAFTDTKGKLNINEFVKAILRKAQEK